MFGSIVERLRGLDKTSKRVAVGVLAVAVVLVVVVARPGGGRRRPAKPAAAAAYTSTPTAPASAFGAPPTTELPAEADCLGGVLAHHSGSAKDLAAALGGCVAFPYDEAERCISSANTSANGDVYASAVGSCLARLKTPDTPTTTTTTTIAGTSTTVTSTAATSTAVEVACWRFLAVSYGGATAPFAYASEGAEKAWVTSCVASGGPPA